MVTVMNNMDTSHQDMIHDAEMDYYGLRLATCSSDNSVKIFDVRDGSHRLVADLKGHSEPIWQVSWSHPNFGGMLASCSYDRRVIVWKEQDEWVKFYEYSNEDSMVNSVQWAPPQFGMVIACGCSDGSITILTYCRDMANWDVKKIPNSHAIACNAVSWGPYANGESVVNGAPRQGQNAKRLVSGGCDNLVKIWKEDNGQWLEESKLEMHSDWVRDVAWAPSIGPKKAMIASCSQDRRVIIWTSDDFVNWTPTVLHTFDDVVWNISWSLVGNILAVSGADNRVSVWKENGEGQWQCLSDVVKGQGQIPSNVPTAL